MCCIAYTLLRAFSCRADLRLLWWLMYIAEVKFSDLLLAQALLRAVGLFAGAVVVMSQFGEAFNV